jgi:hypothetical protein
MRRDSSFKFIKEVRKTRNWFEKGLEQCEVLYHVAFVRPDHFWLYGSLDSYDSASKISELDINRCSVIRTHNSDYCIRYITVTFKNGKVYSTSYVSFLGEHLFFDLDEATEYLAKNRKDFEVYHMTREV